MVVNRVIILGSGPKPDLAFLQQFITEETVFVGVDRGAEYLLDYHLKLDYAIGDFDSVAQESFERIQKVAKYCEVLNTDKDLTDTQHALYRLLEDYPEADYYLFSLLGGRLDHSLANIWIIVDPKLTGYLKQIKLINENNTVSFLPIGNHQIEKDKDKVYLSFISMEAVEDLSLKNVKYELNHHQTNQAVAYISNEFLPGQDTMTVSTDKALIVIQSKD